MLKSSQLSSLASTPIIPYQPQFFFIVHHPQFLPSLINPYLSSSCIIPNSYHHSSSLIFIIPHPQLQLTCIIPNPHHSSSIFIVPRHPQLSSTSTFNNPHYSFSFLISPPYLRNFFTQVHRFLVYPVFSRSLSL